MKKKLIMQSNAGSMSIPEWDEKYRIKCPKTNYKAYIIPIEKVTKLKKTLKPIPKAWTNKKLGIPYG